MNCQPYSVIQFEALYLINQGLYLIICENDHNLVVQQKPRTCFNAKLFTAQHETVK